MLLAEAHHRQTETTADSIPSLAPFLRRACASLVIGKLSLPFVFTDIHVISRRQGFSNNLTGCTDI